MNTPWRTLANQLLACENMAAAVGRLGDADLQMLADALAGHMSYLAAGWDYPDRASRQAEERTERRDGVLYRAVGVEMHDRGMSLSRSTLVPLPNR